MDAGLVVAGLWLAALVYQTPWDNHYLAAGLLAAMAFLVVGEHQGIYRMSWRMGSLGQAEWRILWTWALVIGGLLFMAYAVKTTGRYSRVATLLWFAFVPLLLWGSRLAIWGVLFGLRRHGRNTRTAVIAGAGDLGTAFAGSLSRAPETGIRLLGVYDNQRPTGYRPVETGGIEVRGDLDELVEEVRRGGIDIVYVALPLNAEGQIRRLVEALADTTATVYYLPDLQAFDLLNAHLQCFDGFPLISVYETPLNGLNGWLKRAEDIVIAAAAILVTSLPMLAIAAGILLTSPGPVLFRQQRYGLSGQPVAVWKFRTMTVCEDGVTACVQANRTDARVTPLGRFLRRTSLDELPQFFNVLQGSMSVVGPRPHAMTHNEQYRKLIRGYMLRHKVKPGITGWAQVNGWRGETDTLVKMEMRVKHDLEYLRNWSLWFDLRIVALTVLKGFMNKNAY